MSLETRASSRLNLASVQSGSVANDNTTRADKSANGTRLAIVRNQVALAEFVATTVAAYLGAVAYHLVFVRSSLIPHEYIFFAVFIGVSVSLVSTSFQHFSAVQMRPLHMLLWSGLGAIGLAFSFLLSAIFLAKISEDYSRGTFIFQIVCVAAAVISVRAIAHSLIRSAIASGLIEARHVVLIGNATRCAQFASRLRGSAIQTVASFDLPWNNQSIDDDNNASDGPKARRLIETCRSIRPDDIVILASQSELSRTISLVSLMSELPFSLHIVPTDALELLAGSHIAEFGTFLTIQVHRPPLSALDLAVKRLFDVTAATFGLVVLSPLFLAVAIAIKLDSPGPVFFRQKRHGFNNEPIDVFKFRSMTTLEDGDRFTQAVKNDPRVTRVGQILRRTNIDELPQLINVLQGVMSMVGPRPHATAHNVFFQTKIAPFSRRHTVKPGITGWAQVNGFRGETDTLEKMQQRVEHDLYYIDNWSFLFDVKIVFLTLLSKRSYMNAY